MQFTNAQILAAVLNRWLQPLVQQFAGQRVSGIPLFAMMENKIRSTGLVPQSWSLAAEFSPFMQSITGTVIEPLISSYLSNFPDEAIPDMAHSIVDKAISDGGMSLMNGYLSFDKADMEQLKKLLGANLPLQHAEHYQVKIPEGK